MHRFCCWTKPPLHSTLNRKNKFSMRWNGFPPDAPSSPSHIGSPPSYRPSKLWEWKRATSWKLERIGSCSRNRVITGGFTTCSSIATTAKKRQTQTCSFTRSLSGRRRPALRKTRSSRRFSFCLLQINLTTMPFNIDLHSHSFFSGDGVSSPEDLIAAARIKGLHGLAITDHNTCEAVTYLLEKGLMRLDGQPVDNFLVLPGVEITTADGHLLCIGATLPYLKGKPAREVCEMIHERGGLAIPPHPYDLFRAGIRFSTLETLPVDGIEVFNAATTLRRYNRYAFRYAQLRKLPMTAASDAHHYAAVGTAYTILNTDDVSVKGILAQIVKSNELNQKYQTPRDSLRKTWNNWLRLRRRRKIPELAAKDRSHNSP